MTAAKPQLRVAVLGAGAVGSYYGGMLARSGVPVTLIARPAHVQAIRTNKLLLDTTSFQERVAVEASTEISAAREADVVLFCVKMTDTEDAARSLAPHLAPGAIVVSLQNGVDNISRIRAASGIDALAAVVYIAAAMPEPGHVKHSGGGSLAVGEQVDRSALPGGPPKHSGTERAEQIAALFTPAGVPCRVSPDIEADLWSKFVLNCTGNAITAVTQTTYAQLSHSAVTQDLFSLVTEETLAVARASGVKLPDVDFISLGVQFIRTVGPEATSSMAQDLANGKRTEIDSLNGYLVRRGKELGIATPANLMLFALVKLMEEKMLQKPNGSSQKASV